MRRRVGPDARLHAILRPSFPDLAGGAQTAAAALQLKELGLDGVAFYWHIRLEGLEHVRAALDPLEGVASSWNDKTP